MISELRCVKFFPKVAVPVIEVDLVPLSTYDELAAKHIGAGNLFMEPRVTQPKQLGHRKHIGPVQQHLP